MDINNLIQLARKHYVEGNLVDAENVYRKILKLQANNAGAYYELGNVLQDKGQLSEALLYYKKALNIDPHFSGAYNNLANVLIKTGGQLNEAIYYYQKAIALAPNFAGSYYNLAQAIHDTGQLEEAIAYYRKALQIDPTLGNAYYNLGNALRDTGQLEEAITCYHKALHINPNNIHAYNNLGNALRETGRLEEAVTCYHKALQINPLVADTYGNLGNVLSDQGQLSEAEISYRHALEINPDFFSAYSNLLMMMNYSSHFDAQKIFAEHLCFAKKTDQTLHSTVVSFDKSLSTRRLRIGYVSPDFRRHPVAYFIEPVIIAHNHEQFEVFCYANSSKHDEVTKRIQDHANQWRNIVGMSDDNVDRLIRRDDIDILVDLAGHTANNRILVFAQKPAPVQVSWIGYLATTGLSIIDYKIVDNYTDPPGKTEQFHTEKLIRMPESFLCYLPDKNSPDVGPLPALSTGHITFGSFNNFAKVTSEVFELWSKIFHELPTSRLIMKGKSFHDKTTCQYAINMFTQRGISSERIILQSSDPSPQHLEAYNLLDIGLDTFPFNGATTTCEAMWMGVPVITLAGTAYHARSGISLLSNVGLPELVAKKPDEYVELAVSLATHSDELSILRANLRDRMAHSPLTDAKRFTTNLEKCYREIWEIWCKSI